eukprot:1491571-Rhodomonas_salina.1
MGVLCGWRYRRAKRCAVLRRVRGCRLETDCGAPLPRRLTRPPPGAPRRAAVSDSVALCEGARERE